MSGISEVTFFRLNVYELSGEDGEEEEEDGGGVTCSRPPNNSWIYFKEMCLRSLSQNMIFSKP